MLATRGSCAGLLAGYMGGCQNYGPFLGTLNIRCRILTRIQKGTTFLTTTHYTACREFYKDSNRAYSGLDWLAVKELKLSYYIGETLLFTIYTHYGNLI